MPSWATILRAVSFALLLKHAAAKKIVLTNDDGWAVAQIRAQFDALEAAGFDVSENAKDSKRLLTALFRPGDPFCPC